MITDTTKNDVYDLLKTYWDDNAQYLAVGTGTSTPTASDTSLEAEVLRKLRQDYSYDDNTKKTVVSLWVSSTEANGNDLSEVGVFKQSSGGDMLARNTFSPITKTSDVEVWVDYVIENSVITT